MTTIINKIKQLVNFIVSFFRATRIRVDFTYPDEEPLWDEDGDEIWVTVNKSGVKFFSYYWQYMEWEQTFDMVMGAGSTITKEQFVPWRRWWLAHRIGRIYIALKKLGINIPGFYSVMRWGLVDVRIDDIAYDYDNAEPYAILHLITPKTIFVLAFAIFFTATMIVTGIKQWLNNGDYWCPNTSGTIMEHHVVTDGIDEVVDEDSYPLEVRIVP